MKSRNIKKELGLRYSPDRFSNRAAAFRWASNTIKMSMVILGDDDKFWVVCPADASRLYKMGYEYAK